MAGRGRGAQGTARTCRACSRSRMRPDVPLRKSRVPPHRMLERRVAANTVYAWTADEALARRLSEQSPTERAGCAAVRSQTQHCATAPMRSSCALSLDERTFTRGVCGSSPSVGGAAPTRRRRLTRRSSRTAPRRATHPRRRPRCLSHPRRRPRCISDPRRRPRCLSAARHYAPSVQLRFAVVLDGNVGGPFDDVEDGRPKPVGASDLGASDLRRQEHRTLRRRGLASRLVPTCGGRTALDYGPA